MKRVLILHTSVGHGIKVTAQSIYARLLKSGRYDVRIDDFHEVEPGPIVQTLEKIYFYFTEKAPWIWGLLYTDFVASLTIPFRMFTASFRYHRILKLIRSYEPDIIISTETVPSGVVAYLKRKKLFSGKLVIAFSDYHLHRFWLYNETDLYLCNIPEQADQLKHLGVPDEKLAVTGMIIAEKYLVKIPREQACEKFGLDPKKPVVLLSGGRRGLIESYDIVQQLQKNETSFQIAVVTGKNVELKTHLENLPAIPGHPLKVFGYIGDQDVLMSGSDVIISKPGGPTIAEAIAKRLPVIITDAHPGHETANLKYLTDHGIAWHGQNPVDAAILAEKIIKGEISFDKERNFQSLIEPAGAVSLTIALDRLNIDS